MQADGEPAIEEDPLIGPPPCRPGEADASPPGHALASVESAASRQADAEAGGAVEEATQLVCPPARRRRTWRDPRPVRIFMCSVLLLFLIFTLHMACIAVGVYQLTQMDPGAIVIQRLHLSALDSESAQLRARATLPLPYMTRFFHIRLVAPTLTLAAKGSPHTAILRVSLPDLVVSQESTVVDLDAVQFSSAPGAQSIPALAWQHLKGSRETYVATLAGRIQSRSFWYPLDLPVSHAIPVDLAELLGKLDRQSTPLDVVPPRLTSLRVVPARRGLGMRVQATLQVPPAYLPPFMEVDVPEMEVHLLVLPDGRFADSRPLFLGKARPSPPAHAASPHRCRDASCRPSSTDTCSTARTSSASRPPSTTGPRPPSASCWGPCATATTCSPSRSRPSTGRSR